MRLFGRRTEPVHLPGAGTAIALDDVPDPVFAGRSLGDGFALEPSDGRFTSPVDGEVVTVAETSHAVGLRTPRGAEVLVHVGIDTVALRGEGFDVHVAVGDRVRVGDPLVTVDLAAV
ncbi:PTS sugar transporter subunit IIA, partial [Burkholderia cenocepacia]|uniref:PTS sugar transporter subunit IIA n=1 Tax=Burkholderia cenocepacia TaxID=95486 RepID=UPI0038CC1291